MEYNQEQEIENLRNAVSRMNKAITRLALNGVETNIDVYPLVEMGVRTKINVVTFQCSKTQWLS